MKFYKHITQIDPEVQARWDKFSRTRNPADRPSGPKGPTPKLVISNVKSGSSGPWQPSKKTT